MNNCLSCNTVVSNKYKIYCDNVCQQAFQNAERLDLWLKGELIVTSENSPSWVKRYILERQGHKCNTCGISDWMNKPITLELEHIDGNGLNTVPDNLSCLCPNCHSQTPTFKGRNKGNGRRFKKPS